MHRRAAANWHEEIGTRRAEAGSGYQCASRIARAVSSHQSVCTVGAEGLGDLVLKVAVHHIQEGVGGCIGRVFFTLHSRPAVAVLSCGC